MSESSDNGSAAVFGCLHPDQVTILIEIVHNATLRKVSFIERIYGERARYFGETLQFLKEIGWVRENDEELELATIADRIRNQNTKQIDTGRALVEAIAATPTYYQAILSDYLMQFHADDGRILHRPSVQSRLENSAVRNFLIEAGIVFHETKDDSYILNEYFAHLYLWAKNIHGATSKSELLLSASENDQLGAAAEIAILEFEKKRVGPAWCEHVEHVSAENPGACFDIKSFSILEDQSSARFIEVKAVPANSYQFYWTASEMEAARLLGESYFLYLLPALGGRTFDLSNMKIIQNPYCAVYQSPEKWSVEEKVVLCSRKQDL
jgi:uncharacterized protein DUF3883